MRQDENESIIKQCENLMARRGPVTFNPEKCNMETLYIWNLYPYQLLQGSYTLE